MAREQIAAAAAASAGTFFFVQDVAAASGRRTARRGQERGMAWRSAAAGRTTPRRRSSPLHGSTSGGVSLGREQARLAPQPVRDCRRGRASTRTPPRRAARSPSVLQVQPMIRVYCVPHPPLVDVSQAPPCTSGRPASEVPGRLTRQPSRTPERERSCAFLRARIYTNALTPPAAYHMLHLAGLLGPVRTRTGGLWQASRLRKLGG